MGNRRIGRKRLYGVEKAGQSVALSAGAGISGNIKSASQHRNGQEIITEIAVDLDGLTCGDADKDVIGTASASYLTQLTEATFGIVTEVRVVCVETITNANASITGDGIDVEVGDAADGVASGAAGVGGGGTRTAFVHSVRLKGADVSVTSDTEQFKDGYLYIVNGESATSNSIETGKILIYIHGFEAPSDI